MDYFKSFAECRMGLADMLLASNPIEVGEWQSRAQGKDDPMGITYEIQNCVFQYAIPHNQEALANFLNPNLPWAEDHFQERVGGDPLNPPPSEAYWPFAQAGNAAHKDGGYDERGREVFSHTYPERFWPKQAGGTEGLELRSVRGMPDRERPVGPDTHVVKEYFPRKGIRYRYGDLADVVKLLHRSPKTRQAFLPVWFPEDTGNVNAVRVPCTLGYLFQFRPPNPMDRSATGEFHVTYLIRSCDFLRHWTDDCYMAMRLAQWVLERLGEMTRQLHKDEDAARNVGKVWWPAVMPGIFTFHAMSLHAFSGDAFKLKQMATPEHSQYKKGGVVYDLSKLN